MGSKLIIGIALAGLVAFVFLQNRDTNNQSGVGVTPTSKQTADNETDTMSVIAKGLDTPWGIEFLPDGSMLITERKGTVRLVDSNGNLDPKPVATLKQVKEIGEGGLLGIAVHPDFGANKFVYLYYTYSSNGDNTLNRVVRMKYQDGGLTEEKFIVDGIPGASNHNGGRIKFGPDKYLYITTGDAQEPSRAQDRNNLAGKILRVNDEGEAVADNKFGNRTYSYGHRNPQGIAWDSRGVLWSTEHGPSGAQSGNDEVNIIDSGKNYGWPTIQGDKSQPGMESPIRNSGTRDTWAPGGAAVVGNSLFFGGLRGNALYEAKLQGSDILELVEHFKGELGRIRDVVLGKDGMIYISTSNRDGRGIPKDGDDKIIRINPEGL